MSVFRLNPPGGEDAYSTESLNQLNNSFYKAISARDDIMLTQTSLNGRNSIRFAIGAVRTEEVHVRNAFKLIEEQAAKTIESMLKGHVSA